MNIDRRGFLTYLGVLSAPIAGCASGPDATLDEPRRVLAPTGKLRFGLNQGSPNSLIGAPKSAEAKGLAFDLGRELARRLGVPFEPVVFGRAALMFDAVKAGQVDVIFSNSTAETLQGYVASTPPLIQQESGYLVAPGSAISTLAHIDQPGIKVGVLQGSSSGRVLARLLKNATIVPVASNSEVPAMLLSRKVDAFATNKAILFEISDKLPGSGVLPGAFAMEYLSFVVPKDRERGMAYLLKFSEDVKSEGLVARTIAHVGLRGASPS